MKETIKNLLTLKLREEEINKVKDMVGQELL